MNYLLNFFYGDSADNENFCSFEYDDNALDFGFPEWHIPCDFKFVIEEVYPGTKYEDTCLTGLEMEFMGRRGH